MQTISFETAQKLQELGVKKESYMAFLIDECSGIEGSEPYDLLPYDRVPQIGDHKTWRAYTLDEILGMLPHSLKDENEIPFFLAIEKRYFAASKFYDIGYFEGFDSLSSDARESGCIIKITNRNAAEAAAQLLMWCIENNHLKPEGL